MAETSDARERVLDAAESIFAHRSYATVSLRDVGQAAGIRHPSLYHHFPGGKEALFIAVIERLCQRHRAGIANALDRAAPDVRHQLYAIAEWLLSQPPMDIVRMVQIDLPALAPEHTGRLGLLLLDSLVEPIAGVLQTAIDRGEIAHDNPGLIGGGLLGMLQSLFAIPDDAVIESRAHMAYPLIDVVLDGMRPHIASHLSGYPHS